MTHPVLRAADAGDAAAIRRIYAPVVRETPISFELEVPGEVEIAGRIARVQPRLPWLVAELEGRVAAYAYATTLRARPAYDWAAETTIYVAASARGAGVGRRLYDALMDVLRAQGLFTAFAAITLPNAASVALHESLGFRPIGVLEGVGYKLGAWHDVGFWRLGLREQTADPDPPIPFEELRRTDRLDAILAP